MRARSARDVRQQRDVPPAGRLASAAMLLSISFVLSRVLGLVRTAVIADVFGDSRQIEAYFTAFRIPDTMFMLVSGGALASAFVPVFAGLLEGNEEYEAWRVASSVFNLVCVALAGLAVIAFVLAPLIMDVLVGGGAAPRGLTTDLTRIMLLQPIFLGASALIAGVLQSYDRWLLTALAPLVYNVVVIFGALLGHTYGVVGLAWSVVLAALAQALIQLPGIREEVRTFYERTLDWAAEATREVLRLFGPRIIGLAAFQAMLFITFFLAWRLPKGDVGAINYSWLLISFPVGALGSAAGTVILPSLARFTSREDIDAVRRTVNRSLRLVIFLAVPAAVGLIVLRRPIIHLLYFHGAFTFEDGELAAFALIFYALAVAQLSLIEVLPRVFYAMKDTMTPVKIAVVAVALDAVLSVLLVSWLPRSSGQGGLALATAVATTVQVWLLARALNRRLGGIGWRSLAGTLRDAVIASLSMGVTLYVLLDPLTSIFAQRGIGALVTVVLEVGIGVGVFVGIAYLLGAPELWQVRGFLRR